MDGMLLRKTVALREGIKKGKLNPVWVESMLQQVVEDNRSADFLLRSVWRTLKRPSLKEIGILLERTIEGYQRGFETNLRERLNSMNWNDGPDEIDLCIVTMKNLFLCRREHPLEKEGLVIKHALDQSLKFCPDWVVPALVLHAEKTCPKPEDENEHFQFNLCLATDEQAGDGFGVFFRREWYMHSRDTQHNVSWSSNIKWLFVKPRL